MFGIFLQSVALINSWIRNVAVLVLALYLLDEMLLWN